MKTLYYTFNLFIVFGFLWLGYAARQMEQRGFINQQFAQYDSSKSLTYAQTQAKRRAAALQDLWEVSDNDLTKSVDLFGEHGERK